MESVSQKMAEFLLDTLETPPSDAPDQIFSSIGALEMAMSVGRSVCPCDLAF